MIFAASQMATPGKLIFPKNHLYVRACAKNIRMPNINGKNHIHEWHNTIILMSLKQVHLPLTHIWTHACMRAQCSPKEIYNVHTWWKWMQNAWTKSKNTRRTRIIAFIPIPIHIVLCVQWFQIDANVGDIFFIVIARSLFFVTFLHTLQFWGNCSWMSKPNTYSPLSHELVPFLLLLSLLIMLSEKKQMLKHWSIGSKSEANGITNEMFLVPQNKFKDQHASKFEKKLVIFSELIHVWLFSKETTYIAQE